MGGGENGQIMPPVSTASGLESGGVFDAATAVGVANS